jgi:hypothetical protein
MNVTRKQITESGFIDEGTGYKCRELVSQISAN